MKLYTPLFLASLALAACTERIDHRFEPVEDPGAPIRTVLIEEYTGIDCSNCPDGHAELRSIESRFNTPENLQHGIGVISVGIHIPAFGDPVAQGGMVTPEASDLSNKQAAAPFARVNRQTEPIPPAKWLAAVNSQIIRTPRVSFNPCLASASEASIEVAGSLISPTGINDAKIHAWIVEDDIIDWQLLTDGKTYDPEYSHHAVYRAFMTKSLNGEEISIPRNTETPFSFKYPVNPIWNLNNLRVVIFIEGPGNDGVLNATQTPVQ